MRLEKENQHWVPEFLIKSFVSGGRVYQFNISNNKITKPPSKYVAARPNFNELLVNGDPTSFEQRFGKIESAAAPAIAKIVRTTSLSQLDSRQRLAVSRFVAAQSFRTEAYRVGLGLGHRRYDLGAVLAKQMSDLDALAEIIRRRRWALMVTVDENPFYLGDNPVVLQSTQNLGKGGEVGLDMVGVEAFMPLSPRCALYMPCPNDGSEIVTGFWNGLRIVTAGLAGVEIPDFEVSEALPMARRALVGAEPLYRALMHGEALAADGENVENLNYLQCAWASSAIYSNRSDFAFAIRVFRENPQYRSTLPVSLAERPRFR